MNPRFQMETTPSLYTSWIRESENHTVYKLGEYAIVSEDKSTQFVYGASYFCSLQIVKKKSTQFANCMVFALENPYSLQTV